MRLFKLARNTFFDQVPQLERDLRHFGRGNGRGDCGLFEGWEEPAGFFSPQMAVDPIV
jgi:hypothetical protein